jgi:hypothetical protein
LFREKNKKLKPKIPANFDLNSKSVFETQATQAAIYKPILTTVGSLLFTECSAKLPALGVEM